eukprot:6487258-Amphidinium_carterae.1
MQHRVLHVTLRFFWTNAKGDQSGSPSKVLRAKQLPAPFSIWLPITGLSGQSNCQHHFPVKLKAQGPDARALISKTTHLQCERSAMGRPVLQHNGEGKTGRQGKNVGNENERGNWYQLIFASIKPCTVLDTCSTTWLWRVLTCAYTLTLTPRNAQSAVGLYTVQSQL